MINIDNLTIGQIKEIGNLIGSSDAQEIPFKPGNCYLFRTVTHIDVGEVVSICGQFVELRDASWIADTGRYHDCLSSGTFSEVEPYTSNVFLNTASLIDAAIWSYELPSEQK